MTLTPRAETGWQFAVFLVLAASLPSFMTIPFMAPWPADFLSLWTFHDCSVGRDNPYLATHQVCGPVGDMIYPPLLYWLFAWTRWFRFDASGHIWTAATALGTIGATVAWVPRAAWRGEPGGRTGLFVGLLLAQFPLLFALERGNNDVLVLVTWTLAARLHLDGRTAAAGALAGLSAVLKLYPAFACVVVGVGLVADAIRRREARRALVQFSVAGLATIVLSMLVTYRDSWIYFTQVLPAWAGSPIYLTHMGHPLGSLMERWSGWALSAPLLAAWCVAAALLLRRDPWLVFAGALGISTYFARTSWDYNLITVFPLLVVLFLRGVSSRRLAPFALLLLGLVAIVGHRALFNLSPDAQKLHVALQWIFLLATGLAAPWIARSPGPGTQGSDAPSVEAEAGGGL